MEIGWSKAKPDVRTFTTKLVYDEIWGILNFTTKLQILTTTIGSFTTKFRRKAENFTTKFRREAENFNDELSIFKFKQFNDSKTTRATLKNLTTKLNDETQIF